MDLNKGIEEEPKRTKKKHSLHARLLMSVIPVHGVVHLLYPGLPLRDSRGQRWLGRLGSWAPGAAALIELTDLRLFALVVL